MATRKARCNKKLPRKSDRLQGHTSLPFIPTKPKAIMTPYPLPILENVKMELETVKMENQEEGQPILISNSTSCLEKPRAYSPPIVMLANCHICPGLFVQNEETGKVSHLGGDYCTFASPVDFTTEIMTPDPSPTDLDHSTIFSDEPNSTNSFIITPTTTRTKKRKRVQQVTSGPETEILRNHKQARLEPGHFYPTKLDFNPTQIISFENPLKSLQLWTCGKCKKSFSKQKNYMYHSCGRYVHENLLY